ncbi:MAG: hypothetical protein R3B57_05905 [Phycisphaerales bacterium]
MNTPKGRVVSEGSPSGDVHLGGVCHVVYAYDLGFAVDLDAAQRHVSASDRPQVVRMRRPAPTWFEYRRPPLRVIVEGEAIELEGWRTEASVECLIHDFAGAAVIYRIPFDAAPSALARLSATLYANQTLVDDARRRIAGVFEMIRPAISRPALGDVVEDYIIFAARTWGDRAPSEVIARVGAPLAAMLLAERGAVSDEQVTRALSGRLSYSPSDAAIVDWNAAVLFDEAPEDVVALLVHANIELLEMRIIDDQLDTLLDRAHDLLAKISRRRFWTLGVGSHELRDFAEIQTDAALLFEGVDNAIKLAGDQYLARLYRTAAERLHLPSWDAGVLRKLATADSVYQKMTDAARDRRMELLEIVIILLILISLFTPLIPGLGH